MAPAGSGVTHVNLETGAEKLIVSHELLSKTGTVMENHPTRSITPITCSWDRMGSASSCCIAGRSRRAATSRD
jgi:hypothetical protein